MHIRLWGVRGSYPTPLSPTQFHEKCRLLLLEARPEDLASPEAIDAYLARSPSGRLFGGNTSCIEVSYGDDICVFDAGSGAAALSAHVMKTGLFKDHAISLFFTHFHWDHICGFPFFAPIYVPDQQIAIYSGRDDAERLLATQMSDAHFPVKWQGLPSTITCQQVGPDAPVQVGSATVSLLRLEHPDGAWGYRLDHDGHAICYLTDTEVSKSPDRWATLYSDFVSGADVVIVDAAYGFLDFHEHINWGHSTIFTWIDLFREADIGELVIFHHDPLADDPALINLLESARRYRELVAPDAPWKLSAAYEGQTWDL